FCPDGRSLFVFDKAQKRSFRTGVANIASEQRFYDLPPNPTGAADSQVVEKTFSTLEGGYAAAVRELLDEVEKREEFTPGPSERNLAVAHFLALQFCRTREFRDTYKRMLEGLSKAVAKKHELVRQAMAARGEVVADAMPEINVPESQEPLQHA